MLLTFVGVLISACGDSVEGPESSTVFIAPVGKRSKNLQKILGKEFYIITESDTLGYRIIYEGNKNRIVRMKDSSVIFNGIITKVRGIYFLNDQQDDSSWIVSAIRIRKGMLSGLEEYWQPWMVNEDVENDGVLSTLDISTDSNNHRLRMDKKIVTSFYKTVLDQSIACRLWFPDERKIVEDEDESDIDIKPEGSVGQNLQASLFPNPASDIITIATNMTEGNKVVEIYNDLGILQKQLSFSREETRLDVQDLPQGWYIVKVKNTGLNDPVLVKLRIEK